MSYLFDFAEFVGELRNNEKKCPLVKEYEKFYGLIPMESTFESTKVYKHYVKRFKITPKQFEYFNINERLIEEFDWKLLLQLIASSFHSNYKFEIGENGKIDCMISVTSDNRSAKRKMSKLWSFETLSLFEIYVDEQLNLFTLIKSKPKKAESIQDQQKLRQKLFETAINSIVKTALKIHKVEKQLL